MPRRAGRDGSDREARGAISPGRGRRARGGDWHPYEQLLQSLGARYSRAGFALSGWYEVATAFHDTAAARAVESAIEATLADPRLRTADLGGTATTVAAGKAIAERVAG